MWGALGALVLVEEGLVEVGSMEMDVLRGGGSELREEDCRKAAGNHGLEPSHKELVSVGRGRGEGVDED